MKKNTIILSFIGFFGILIILSILCFLNTGVRNISLFGNSPIPFKTSKNFQKILPNLKGVGAQMCLIKEETFECWDIGKDKYGIFYNIFSRWYRGLFYIELQELIIKKVGPHSPSENQTVETLKEALRSSE